MNDERRAAPQRSDYPNEAAWFKDWAEWIDNNGYAEEHYYPLPEGCPPYPKASNFQTWTEFSERQTEWHLQWSRSHHAARVRGLPPGGVSQDRFQWPSEDAWKHERPMVTGALVFGFTIRVPNPKGFASVYFNEFSTPPETAPYIAAEVERMESLDPSSFEDYATSYTDGGLGDDGSRIWKPNVITAEDQRQSHAVFLPMFRWFLEKAEGRVPQDALWEDQPQDAATPSGESPAATPAKRPRGRPRKNVGAPSIDEGRTHVKVGTSPEMRTIYYMNLGGIPPQALTTKGLDYLVPATRRRATVSPAPGEIQGEGQVAEYVGKVMRHRGPMAVKALIGALRRYDEAIGMGKAGTHRVRVSELVRYCGYRSNPKTQTIRDIANGLVWISRIEIDVETVTKWGTKDGHPFPVEIAKTKGHALNLERRGYLQNLFEDDPETGDVSTYWVEYSIPQWLREQLAPEGSTSGQMWWPMLEHVLTYDASTQRPLFCLGIYLAPILRMGRAGAIVTRSAEEIAKASGWEPNGKTTRWLDSLKKFLVQLHQDMPECVPEPTFHDPADACPSIAANERYRGFRVEWRVFPSMLAAAN